MTEILLSMAMTAGAITAIMGIVTGLIMLVALWVFVLVEIWMTIWSYLDKDKKD